MCDWNENGGDGAGFRFGCGFGFGTRGVDEEAAWLFMVAERGSCERIKGGLLVDDEVNTSKHALQRLHTLS